MAMTMAQASAAMREAMRETVKRYSTWYLLEGVLLVVAGGYFAHAKLGWRNFETRIGDSEAFPVLEMLLGFFAGLRKPVLSRTLESAQL